MRQILLFAALAASLALLAGCALSKTKKDTAEDITDKAAYHKISAEEAYEMMASRMPPKSCWRWGIRASTTSAASSTGPTSL